MNQAQLLHMEIFSNLVTVFQKELGIRNRNRNFDNVISKRKGEVRENENIILNKNLISQGHT